MIGIKSIACCLSEAKQLVENLPEYKKLPDSHRLMFDSCGIKTIRVNQLDSQTGIAIQAAKEALTNGGVGAEVLDMIIFLQVRAPEYLSSSTAAKIQFQLGAEKAICFTISDLGCVDISAAIFLAKSLLTTNTDYQNILVVYASNQLTTKRFRYPVTIIGDGGMALLISKTSSNAIIDCELEVNGKYWDLFFTDYRKKHFQDWEETCTGIYRYSFELAVESKNRFANINRKILMRNQLDFNGIQHFIMQNISLGAFRFYEDLFEIKFASVCRENLAKYGHLGSMDVIFNLHSGIEEKSFKQGDKILIMNNSPIAAWSVILLQI